MFRLLTYYLSPLKHIPLAAWIADAMMMTWYSLFNHRLAEYIDNLVLAVSQWEGMTISIHRFGGRQFNYHDKELGHIHSNGVLDILVSRNTKEELLAKGLAEEHHTLKASGWISFYLERPEDYEKAISVLRIARNSKQKRTA